MHHLIGKDMPQENGSVVRRRGQKNRLLGEEKSPPQVEEKLNDGTAEPNSVPAEKELRSPSTSLGDRIFWLTALTVLSFAIRLYKIDYPPWVCWDETHFGKMASWYINRTFFFDVHPPLGKMSIALVGYLTGYNGTFAWDKPGDHLLDHPYTGMRVYCAILGSLLVPLTFEIAFSLTESVRAAKLSGAMVLFDGGMATLTRYILLDAPLLFFIMATAWAFVKSREYEHRITSGGFISWLSLCGFFLACAISVKFVGVFIVFWVGFGTIFRLLKLWSDYKLPISVLLREFLVRALCLILLPALCYVIFFWIHLSTLTKSGPGDGFYTSAFQSSLIGNPLNNATMPAEVAFGAVVAMKNTKGNGAYLHSHPHNYPDGKAGEEHQQITCYSHKDDNNLWLIKKADPRSPEVTDSGVQLLRHGDLVRLNHLVSGKFLHSHRKAAPVTRHHFQVSAFGTNVSIDTNDVWQIEIENGRPGDVVKTMTSHFRLVHQSTKCALESGTKQLPKWGWEQLEVTCNPRPKRTSFDNELFHVEWVHFPLLPNVTFADHAPGFLSKFIESHVVMIKGNSGLKPKEGEVFSKSYQWPLDWKGQWFSVMDTRIYLLGNPIIWWSCLVCWAVYLTLEMFFAVRRKRKYQALPELDSLERMLLHSCRWMLTALLIHYLPFYGMGRILYYHHYFPAQLFSSLLSGMTIDLLTRVLHVLTSSPLVRRFLEFSEHFIIIGLLFAFYLFYPLVYGMQGPFADFPESSMHGRPFRRILQSGGERSLQCQLPRFAPSYDSYRPGRQGSSPQSNPSPDPTRYN